METQELSQRYIEEMNIKTTFPFTNHHIFQYEKAVDKHFAEFEDYDFVDFFFQYMKIESVSTLNTYRTAYYQFYEWLTARHLAAYNVFKNSALLQSDSLCQLMANMVEIEIYDEGYIEYICSTLKEQQIILESIIRGIYEGIKIAELAVLTIDKVDFKQNKVTLSNGFKKTVSPRLALCLKACYHLEVSGIENPDLIFKVKLYNSDADEVTKIHRSLARQLREYAKEQSISLTPKKLYDSGLLNFILKSCDYDYDTFYRMMGEDKYKRTTERLNSILEAYGSRMSAKVCRYFYKQYVHKIRAMN